MHRRHRESSEVMLASSSTLLGPGPAPQRRLDLKKKMKPLNRKHLAQEAEQTSKVLHWPRKPARHAAWALERKPLEQLGGQRRPRLTLLLSGRGLPGPAARAALAFVSGTVRSGRCAV